MAYEVTARKWRPQEFDGVIGQEHVTTTLKNAIQAGQIAHAYLFAGPRGVGKTTTARILAKALNCVEGPTVTPCNACTICREISEGRSVDVLEIDGASNNRVEQVRTHLLESVKYTPSQGKHKIYIIDEVHMLTKEAFNALLKTLEEPPPHVYFIFATTDPRKVIPTVLSRCQRFDFRRISGPTIVDHLAMISEKSGYGVQPEALALIARRVDGSMRDAESLLDQVVAFGGTGLTARAAAEVLGIVDQDVYFELFDIVADQDVPRGLDLVDRIFRQGHDLEEIILGVLEHLRNLLVVKAAPEADTLLGAAALELDRYREQVTRFETEDLLRLSQLATQMEQAVRQSTLPRVQLETGIVRMIRMARSVQLTDVMARLSEMARRVGSGEEEDASGTDASGTDTSGTDTSGTETSSAETSDTEGSEEAKPPARAQESTRSDARPEVRGATESRGATEPGLPTGEASETSPSQTTDPPAGTAPAPSIEEGRSPAESAESSAATTTAPKLDLQAVRNSWPAIVEEITRQRSGLGNLLAKAVLSACSPSDDARSEGPGRITLRFESSQVFHKQQIEKRENALLIQAVCSKALGIPVRIKCEIDDSAAAEDATRVTEDARSGTDDDRGRAEDTGSGPDEYPGAVDDSVQEGQNAPSTGTSAAKETSARSGAAKDPAVMKIVEAFDGQIVKD
ncbi:MAG: DNA polymerase III subunit gamma/tau [Gemmatimonadetes bacterium]|nr:DNA polymerase III subunit gamma/tau [Gemmatimonadota bacterium]